ncbi:S10 family peptidase [Lutimonas zeaxanthinifaciens]|uniref:S10 family peptidase n=1 Tax=Lutimonas zeaxanthinifaciens TaxID=3060215 RepID=UPI00265C9527|nr:carboxypeptidase [Lutimonas sp. YSD2104]WKK67395.1 carboxypeptidase [Lutimonas sp. YSD2104]
MKCKGSILIFLLGTISLWSQELMIPKDTVIKTKHSTTIRGQKINYTAQTGMQPVWDEQGKAIATLHYTYYKRDSEGKPANRPLLISFNGGPGSASLWMHMAYTGPKLLRLDDEGYPVQPYGIEDNEHSVLDIADIVYVNPVNTGYSRTIPLKGEEVKRDKFFGVNADIKYLAGWLTTFVNRNNRWLSPKFLIGESYGGTRVSGLAHELQQSQWMYLNGVILVSPADYKFFNSDPAISSALNLPYFTASSWFHKILPPSLQEKDLLEILPESEQFALNQLMPAMAKGGSLSFEEKTEIAKEISKYSGLEMKTILDHNLNVPKDFYWKELLRDREGYTIGRLDSRYKGIDKMLAGSKPDYNAAIVSWNHAFTPAINHYMRNYLKFETDIKYNVFGPVHPWDRRDNNTRENLRKAMANNPYLNLLFQSGYYDGATTYFSAKYTMWQLDRAGKLQDRMDFKGYRSGHMMYLRNEDLKTANEDLRAFIKKSTEENKPAKYD